MKKNMFLITGLFLLVMGISAVVIPSTLSIFKSSSNATSAIELAEWDVSLNQTGINNTLNLVSGVTNRTYTLRVRSTSEVDVDYSIEISGLPSGIEVSLDGGTFKTQTNNKIIFNDVGTILYSDSSKQRTHTLEFKSNIGTEESSNVSVDIDVIIKQIL